ncbi:MAG: lytic transglycosylase domain-containing protein [Halothiobacillaceae bacterium]
MTNCTNIGTGKSSSAKPAKSKPPVSVHAPVAKATQAMPQTTSTSQTVQTASAPTSMKQGKTTYVYTYKRNDGSKLLTNVPDKSLPLLSTLAYQSFDKGWTGSAFKSGHWTLNREAYNETILAMANEKSVDPNLVRAVIHAESSFNPNAVSRTGAMGLMQLMPGTAARFGVGNAFDPQENIRGGVTYLRFLLDKFNGDIRLAAAGYNAGEGAVMKYGGVPPYNETTQYVARVLDLHGKYRGQH